jgi:hypothetical protein
MAITIPVTHAAKQKNSRRSPKSTGMFTPPPCSLCLTIFVGTGRNGNSLSIMGHESLQTSCPNMPALNSERSRSFGVNESVARSAQDWRGLFRELHSRRQLFANALMAASRVAVP